MALDDLQNGISGIVSNVSEFVKDNPVGTAIGVGSGIAGVGLVSGAIIGASKKRKRRKSRTVRKRNYRGKRKQKRRHRRTPRTAGKRKDRSSKRIRYTKKGQPYIIQRNGRARFIKKSSAKRSHKLKGGRY